VSALADSRLRIPTRAGARRRITPKRCLRSGAATAVLIGCALLALGGSRTVVPRHVKWHVPSPLGLLSLPAAARGPISASLGLDDPAYRVRVGAAGLEARNAPQHLRASFARHAVTVTDGRESVSLSLRSYGTGPDLRPVVAAVPRLVGGRVDYTHGDVTESWVNGPLGLEQGFELARAPAGRIGAPVVLALALGGNMHVRLAGGQVTLDRAGVRLRYDGLRATDARGRTLRTRFELRGHEVRILVNTAGARYPIRIDPFVQQAELTASDAGAEDSFGSTVAISGDTIVVGEPRVEGGIGAVYVFTMPALGGWANAHQTAELTASDNDQGDGFGASVTISGDTIVAGSPDHEVGGDPAAGAVYVFTEPASGGWTNLVSPVELTAADGSSNDDLGASVAIAGDTIVAGAPGRTVSSNSKAGTVYVFTPAAGGGWAGANETELTPSGAADVDEEVVGTTVAISADGSTVAAGGNVLLSTGQHVIRPNGAVLVFQRPPAGAWSDESQSALLTVSGVSGEDLGSSLALLQDGDTVVAGAPGSTINGSADQGALEAFTRPETGWADETAAGAELDIGAAGAAGDLLGYGVGLAGNTIFASAPGSGSEQGAVYEFTEQGGAWTTQHQATAELPAASDGAAGDLLGASLGVSSDGKTVVAGADNHATGMMSGEGDAYVFVVPVPVDTVLPGITGTAQPGQTLSCSTGSWTNSPTSYAYQWNRDGAAIVGATSSTYAVQAGDTGHALTCTVIASDADGPGQGATSLPVTVQQPSTLAFTISPDTDPLLSHQTITFAVKNPIPGTTYDWDFGDQDKTPGSASSLFVSEADGASVTYAYPDPPVDQTADNKSFTCPQGVSPCTAPTTREAVYVVRVQAQVAGVPTVSAMPQTVVVVPVKPPTAAFTILRSSQDDRGTGSSSVVTHPITVVPQATLPGVDTNTRDSIAEEAFWFNGSGPPAKPDMVCLPNGTCGAPGAINTICFKSGGCGASSGPTPLPGQENLGTGRLSANGGADSAARMCKSTSKRSCPETYVPTAGFESFSMNFWDQALADIGSSSEPQIPAQPQLAGIAPVSAIDANRLYQKIPATGQPPLVTGYPPLASVHLNKVDGYKGEQGVPFANCFPGYPSGSYTRPYQSGFFPSGYPQGAWPFPAAGEDCGTWFGPPTSLYPPLLEPGGAAAQFGPYDLAKYGVGSTQQLEDQWNFLYNYATVAGLDTPLDNQFGPGTGATKARDGSTIPRKITMVAYDAEGIASAPVTQNVTLTPASNPTINGCLEDALAGNCVKTPTSGSPLPLPITAGSKLQFVPNGSTGGDDPIEYYAIEVGQPNNFTFDFHGRNISSCDAENGVGSWTPDPGQLGVPPKGSGEGGSGNPPAPGHHGLTGKQSPTGPGASPDLPIQRLASGAPVPVPVFSDLLDGAFPLHNCQDYADRTVDPFATPQPVPASGPVSVAIKHRATAGTGPGVGKQLGPVVGDPVLIAGPNQPLDFKFAQPGIYSLAIAAYNSAGLGAITRIDGLVAQAGIPAGQCKPVTTQTLFLDGAQFGFSGSCMTVVSSKSGDPVLYATTQTMDVNGVPVAPSRGDAIVIRPKAEEIYVAPCHITSAELEAVKAGGSSDGLCAPPANVSGLGCMFLALGTSKDTNGIASQCDEQSASGTDPAPTAEPGMAYFAHVYAADTPPTDLKGTPTNPFEAFSKVALNPVGTAPTQNSIPGTSTPGDASGCGIYESNQPGTTVAWLKGADPQYNQFNVASAPCVSLTAYTKSGSTFDGSRIGFWDYLPDGFGDSAQGQPNPTSSVVLYGVDDPVVSFVSTHPYAGVAGAHRSDRPTHIVAGSFPAPRHRGAARDPQAHAADNVQPGFPDIPNCPADTSDDNSGLTIPSDTDLGAFSLPPGDTKFCRDPATGDFIGNVMISLNAESLPVQLPSLDVGFELGHGQLIDAGGDLKGPITLPPGVTLNELKFDIQTDPDVVAGEIDVAIGQTLELNATGIVDSTPDANGSPPSPYADFNGAVSIAGIQFADFDVDFNADNTIGMHVDISQDFGPASLSISVSGGVGFNPDAFYLEGDGSACLWVCLDVKGLLSNLGLAACGSINLVLGTISAGAAVVWSGPNSGVHVFTGCDLTPYIPPSLQNINGTAVDTRRPAADALPEKSRPKPKRQPVLEPGQFETFPLCVPAADAPGGCTKSVVSVQVHSLASEEAPGQTPLVTLTSPDGSRVVTTPAVPGDYGFAPMNGSGGSGQTDEGTEFVDQNAVPVADTVNGEDPGDAANSGDASTADCPISSSATAGSAQGSCPKVTTTTLFVADPGPGNWKLAVEPGSPPVVDTAVAVQEVPSAAAFNGTVDKVAVKPLSRGAFDLKIHGHTYSSSLASGRDRLLLAPSLDGAAAARGRATAANAGKPALRALQSLPSILWPRLRAVVLKVPNTFAGTVAVLDHSAGGQQVLASGIAAGDIPKGGLPIAFEPNYDPGRQQVQAFLSNSEGMPMNDITLSTFREPMPATPAKPKLVRVVRRGSTVDVYVKPGDGPIINGVGLAIAVHDGQQIQLRIPADQLRAIGRKTGLGSAAQAPEYEAKVPDVDPTVPITIAVDTFDADRLSPTTRTHVRAAIKSTSSRRLLSVIRTELLKRARRRR
jgi:hypothetical protein